MPPKRLRQKTTPEGPIRELWEELNVTSAAKLKTAQRKRDIPYNAQDAVVMVKRSEARQLVPKKHPCTRQVWSTSPNNTWQAYLIDYTAMSSSKRGKPYTHILAVMDMCARRLFMRPLERTPPQDVIRAFKELAAEPGHPKDLNTDKGAVHRRYLWEAP